ncbi:MAG TPA: hypothetical protein VN641_21815 [Urbifossiella sp.]|nr:hypothetical protein [Urbifossiella sp.]
MNLGTMLMMGSLAAGGPVAPGVSPVPAMGPHAAVAGMPPPSMMMPFPMPAASPAPVLAARVLAPQGVRVAFYPGSPLARLHDTPAVVGLRPGYRYRLELSNLPYHPGERLYPEVEVRATLVPRNGMKYMAWPAPLLFTPGDIEHALLGSMITKAIYLEDPEKAIPAQFGLSDPVETSADSESDAFKEALASGRIVAIVRLGNRRPNAATLKASAIDGTILLPNESYLKSPLAPPTLPYHAAKLYDPLLGPKSAKEECFADGGDRRDPLAIGPNQRLAGLDPTDVGVEYTLRGQRKVTTSNRVNLCVPRFAIQRAEMMPEGYQMHVSMRGTQNEFAPQGVHDRAVAMANVGREKPVGAISNQMPKAYIGPFGTSFFFGLSRPSAFAQRDGVQVKAAVVEPEVITAFPGAAPLTVTKSVDASGPVESGTIVTFTIRYLNTGNRPISEVVVSDSLSGRLEYVAGTNQSDRAANFSASANEAGSMIVRWELPGAILPGQGGVVKFKAKVR